MNINNQEPINNYINVLDVCGNNVSVLDVDVNYDIDNYNDFDTQRFIINHTTDLSGNLFYSIDRTENMTQNWINEIYTTQYVKCNAGDINLNVGIDTEYKIYNKNKLASELLGVDCAGNVLIWIDDEFLSDIDRHEQIKEIKNFCMRTNLINYADIKI